VRRVERRFAEALSAAARAVDVGPSDVHAWHNMAGMLYCLGRCEEALVSVERAMDLNPMPSVWTLQQRAAALWGNGRHEEAVRVASETLVRLPGLWTCEVLRMCALFESGRLAEARKDAASLMARMPQITASRFADPFADEAVDLRERCVAAARACGIP
jgi:tetratricopeptide (TPR) repeat protein